jgi:hypothetical protein
VHIGRRGLTFRRELQPPSPGQPFIKNHGVTSEISFLVSWGGVRLSPLGTSATNWPIVPAPDDR